MKILFQDVGLLDAPISDRFFVAVDGAYITYIGKEAPKDFVPDRRVLGRGRLLASAFYNAHSHAAMTLFRGYGEDLPLQEWLETRIFPAEEHLSEKKVYLGSLLAAAEMIRNGIVSFSDMYFFCEGTIRAVAESGMKANISRSVVSFDPTADYKNDSRIREGLHLFDTYNGAEDGRIRVDLSLHAEYTNVAPAVAYLSEEARKRNAAVQIHLSETEKEHMECLTRHGVTPTRFFYDNGLFENPVVAAHGVYLADEDLSILAERGATVVHNPVSNLKLGSGIMPLRRAIDKGVNVALGTDGVASNNRHDMLREMQLAALLQKGVSRDPASISARDVFRLATENGARAQRRLDSGKIEVGFRADLVLYDTSALHNIPLYDHATMLAGSAASSDVTLTMADGKILYEDGEYQTVDTEKLRADFSAMHRCYFD